MCFFRFADPEAVVDEEVDIDEGEHLADPSHLQNNLAALKSDLTAVTNTVTGYIIGYTSASNGLYALGFTSGTGEKARPCDDHVCRPAWRLNTMNGCPHRCAYCSLGGAHFAMVNLEAYAEHLAERSYTALSGGERQRVQLARVLAQIWPSGRAPAPRWLLLDEPTNNLDLLHQQRLMETARRFADRGLGVLAILHDPNLAAAYADRVVVLADGMVQDEGSPEAVLTPARLRESFGIEATVIRHPRTDRPVVLPA